VHRLVTESRSRTKCRSSPQACTGSEREPPLLAYQMHDMRCCGSFPLVPFGTSLVGPAIPGVKRLGDGITDVVSFTAEGRVPHFRMFPPTITTPAPMQAC